jgi:hypothetical protein
MYHNNVVPFINLPTYLLTHQTIELINMFYTLDFLGHSLDLCSTLEYIIQEYRTSILTSLTCCVFSSCSKFHRLNCEGWCYRYFLLPIMKGFKNMSYFTTININSCGFGCNNKYYLVIILMFSVVNKTL